MNEHDPDDPHAGHIDENDPVVVVDDAYVDYLTAGGEPPSGDQIASELARLRDRSR